MLYFIINNKYVLSYTKNLSKIVVKNPFRNRLLLVLTAAALLRLLVPLGAWAFTGGVDAFTTQDSEEYIELAESAALNGSFERRGAPEIIRPPGYPVILVPGVWLGAPVAWAIILQAAASALSAYVVFLLGSTLFDEKRGFIAAVIFAFEPVSTLYSSLVLTETVFTLFVLLFVYFAARWARKASSADALAAGLALALATFIHPGTYYLPLVVLIFFALRALKKRDERTGLVLGAMLFLAAATVPTLTWQVRNYSLTGYRRFAAIEDVNLYFMKSAAVRASVEGRSIEDIRRETGYGTWNIYDRAHPEQAGWTRAEKLDYMRKTATKTIFAHPGVYAGIHARSLPVLLFDPGAREYLRLYGAYRHQDLLKDVADKGLISTALKFVTKNPAVSVFSLALLILLAATLAAAAWGWVKARAWRNAPGLAALLVFLYILLVAGGPSAYARFRVPLMPLFAVYAAVAVAAFLEKRKARSAK